MKKSLPLAFLILFLLFSPVIYASHYMGGEITWECLSNGINAGKYIFTIKAYRECGGITYGSSQTLSSNSPVGSLTLSLVPGWPKDISPVCNANANFPHITCNTATTSNTGAVSEYIWVSSPVTINGVPPATGWMFYWGSCCRNPATNISGQPSWRLRAIMYPYNNKNAFPCFDNSPTFAEKPRTVVPTGVFSFNNMAFDPELDSLAYKWGEPLQSSGAPLTYSGGYTYLNPLPGLGQNSSNVAAVMDSSSGKVDITCYSTGAFVTSVKVTSYRAGIKISEIWRDIQVVITPNSGGNLHPNVTPPFNSGTSYNKTVYAGDTVAFNISVTDFQFLPNGSPQTMDIKVFGQQFGEFIPPTNGYFPTLSATSGCITPPCATVTPAPSPNYPLEAPFGVQTQFRWVTGCQHLNPNLGPNNGSNIYRFLITSQDDYCPVPAIKSGVITITVLDRLPLTTTTFENISYDYDSLNALLSWYKVVDPHNQFDGYFIYYASSPSGSFALIDSVMDINVTNAKIHLGPIVKGYFYLKVKSHTICKSNLFSNPSAIYPLNLTGLDKIIKNDGFYLLQNRPNPASKSTVIEFVMDKPLDVTFQLTSPEGRLMVKRKIQTKSGLNSINLDLSSLSAGIYYYSVKANGIKKSAKMVVLKK